MRMRRRGVLGLGLAILLAAPALAADEARRAEAMAMVQRGIADVAKLGPEAAFALMNQGEASGYKQHELYIFVVDTASGRVVVQANEPARIGLDVATLKDVDGTPYGRMFLDQATAGGVWVPYKRENPTTGVIEPKESFVVRSGDHVYGVGVYN